MAYDILRRLMSDKRKARYSVTVSHIMSSDGMRTIPGDSISGLTRKSIEYRGGESGQEIMTVPLKDIMSIEMNGAEVYHKKKRIERIYPRH